MKFLLIFVLSLVSIHAGEKAGTQRAQPSTDTYQPKLEPFTKDNHFVSKDWYNWGGSVIKGGMTSIICFIHVGPKPFHFTHGLRIRK